MSIVSKRAFIFSALSTLALAGSAHATLFSFASDDDSGAFTFRGTAATGNSFNIRNGSDPASNTVTLRVDDNNGSRPTAQFAVGFRANITAQYQGSVGMMGSQQTHAYSITGTFAFVDRTSGADLLLCTFTSTATPGLLSIGGRDTTWGTGGSALASDSASGVSTAITWTATPAFFTFAAGQSINLADYGVAGSTTASGDDFAFTLTALNTNGGSVPIDSVTRLPSAAFQSEGSMSGTASFVPAPSTLGLLGAAGLASLRRRRR